MKEKKQIMTGIVTVKNKHLLYFLLVIYLFGGTSGNLYAQCQAKNEAFNSGEVLAYDLYFNWKFIWLKAGTARMTTSAVNFQSKPSFSTHLLAISSKRIDKFFRMRDTLNSIYTERLEPLYFRKGAEEGKHYTVDEARFSYRDGYCFINQKRTHRDGSVVLTEDVSEHCVYDMLSILAQARSFDPDNYKKGDRIYFPMATGRKVEEQILIYRGKENFEANNDTTYRCLVFSLVEMKGKKEKEVITFYVTDDKNHLPIRLDLFLNFGSAKAFLKTAHGIRHPQSSIVTK
ncbi:MULTISPECIES: DUF3108 domain-containing protein [unclassified Bacteroides]|jgi:hypothetical protein|uniref:DUF3108 domain-containing protein n=1 Tax=unclassified Bacteroides TaxID=2646097 RepID=UPI000E827FD6|nr:MULTISPECIES: DUF3108 domain-containing protein [unclassified Bacteroides]RGN51403.1 DUF3108 domain-containing protein [Bacteroides sp. OM05-12]RHR78067.1 DUF3108 domain-containing protein [Bacteroides sp. AF16-49]